MSFAIKLVPQKNEIDPTKFLDGLGMEDLFQEANFNAFKYAAFYFIDNRDQDGAAEFAKKLERLITGASAKAMAGNAGFELIIYWLLKLKLFAFMVLPLQDQVDLFKKYGVEMLKNNFDLRAEIFKVIDLFSSQNVITEFCRNILSALLSSPEYLGQNIATAEFKPTVGVWLNNYQKSINKRGSQNVQPAMFDIVTFINSDEHARGLLAEDREALRSLLSLYNWLLNPVLVANEKEWEQIELKTRQQQAQRQSEYITQERFTLPESVMADQPAPALLAQPVQPTPPAVLPVQPAPLSAVTPLVPPKIPLPGGQPAATKINMSEVMGMEHETRNMEQRDRSPSVVKSSIQSPITQKQPDIKSILPNYKKPTGVPLVTAETLAAQIEKKKKDQEQVINQKLHDLDDRVHNKQ